MENYTETSDIRTIIVFISQSVHSSSAITHLAVQVYLHGKLQ